MKHFTSDQKSILEWLAENKDNNALSLKSLLEKFFFSKNRDCSLIIQYSGKYAMLFINSSEYAKEKNHLKYSKELMAFLHFLNYLKSNGYISIIKNESLKKQQIHFVGEVFQNPHVKGEKLLLNDAGLYSVQPEKILDDNDNVLYESIPFKDEYFDIIYDHCLGYLYVDSHIKELLVDKKKPKQASNHFAWLILFIAILISMVLFQIYLSYKNQKATEDLFNRFSTKETITKVNEKSEPKYGLDISKWNGDLLEKTHFKDYIKFIIIKATEGVHEVDSRLKSNWSILDNRGLKKGTYHVYRIGEDPIKQAKHFFTTVKALEGEDFPPIVDISSANMKLSSRVDSMSLQFELLDYLKEIKRLFNKKPMIYSNVYFANQYITYIGFSRYPLWIADYSSKRSPRIPNVWKDKGAYIWQKSESYDVDSLKIDLDLILKPL